MPLYEYHCPKDGTFELVRKFKDPPLEACPTCGGPIEKLISAPAIQFKGTGWYITDYARKSTGGEAAGKKEGDAGKKDGEAAGKKDAETAGKKDGDAAGKKDGGADKGSADSSKGASTSSDSKSTTAAATAKPSSSGKD